MRRKNNMTQDELASKIFISRSMIAKYEKNYLSPTNETLNLLANTLNVPANYFDDDDAIDYDKIKSSITRKYSFIFILIATISIFILFICNFVPMFKDIVLDLDQTDNQFESSYVLRNLISISLIYNNYFILIVVALDFAFILASICLLIKLKKRITFNMFSFIVIIGFILFFLNIFNFILGAALI